jgi:DNA-binding transcriptional ArsR family regulator
MTIKIYVTPDDLLETRFAYSPLVELSNSFQVLVTPAYHPLYRRWVDEALRALHGVELPFMESLILPHDPLPRHNYVPDFLTPTPTIVQLSLEPELEQLMNLPDEIIHASIHRLIENAGESEIRLFFLNYTREAVYCLVEELRLYWRRTLESHWNRLTAILDGDVLYHARRLAVEGPEEMLRSMHPKLTFRDGMIELLKNRDEEFHLEGRGMQLVPSIFAGDMLSYQLVPEWQPMLLYSPRGLGLWQQSVRERNPSLELALGEGRARVLQTLATPSNTGEIARRLDISAGAASQHLSRLQQAGLVEPNRSGRRVYYRLTDRGAQLLTLFERAI